MAVRSRGRLDLTIACAMIGRYLDHAGKIYNVLARRVAEAIVAAVADVSEAHCLIMSRIGAPICAPALVHLRLAMKGALRPKGFERRPQSRVRIA